MLAKLDTDANPQLSQAFRIQGIPAVKAFSDGQVVSEFVGAQPPPQVEQFFDALVPSEADALVEAGDEESLRRALELEPTAPTRRSRWRGSCTGAASPRPRWRSPRASGGLRSRGPGGADPP